MDDALRRGLTSLARLRWFVDVHSKKGRNGSGAIKRLLAEKKLQERVTESGLETRLFQVLRRASLPLPVAQFAVRHEGRVVGRADFAYPHARLAIEAVSYRWHSARANWNRDQTRSNALVALGWRILNVTWDDLRDRPEHVVATIRAALGEIGVLFR
jgi:very-short-patch-repair endonuclease